MEGIMQLRVMSYNIQHGFNYKTREGITLDAMADVIRAVNPDLVGLNEVRGRGKTEHYTAQAEALAAMLGYHCYFGRAIFVGGTEPYGNAVLSKYPIESAKVLRIPDPVPRGARVESRVAIRAEVLVGTEARLAAYVSHFGLSPAEHEHAVSTLSSALAMETLPFVLMGDFNMTPDNPLLRPFFETLVDTSPYTDGQRSFPSDNPTEKIDYIFASPGASVQYAEIPAVVASDHCPIYADLAWGE